MNEPWKPPVGTGNELTDEQKQIKELKYQVEYAKSKLKSFGVPMVGKISFYTFIESVTDMITNRKKKTIVALEWMTADLKYKEGLLVHEKVQPCYSKELTAAIELLTELKK